MSALERDYLAAVEAENDALRERIKQLEEALGVTLDAPIELGLTGQQSRLFGMLYRRDLVTKELVMTQLYSARADEAPEIRIVDVFVCHLRRKLKPFGIEIATKWGQGYLMPPASKAKVAALLNKSPSVPQTITE